MDHDSTRQPDLSPKDRISQLPSQLLLHLLSFMSREEAAPMKLLSRTWRNLFALTNLSFYCEEFNRLGKENFEIYVKNALLNREKTHVDMLRVIWLDEKSDSWLDYAAENKVKVVHVILQDGKKVKLPESILTCVSLEELAILSYPKLNLKPNKLNLVSLKKLVLQVIIIKDKCMEQIISGCPVLEELHIVICKLENIQIRSKTLKRLIIERCRVGFGFDYEEFYIITPNLEYLWYNAVWQGLLCKEYVRANYISNVSTKLFLEFPKLNTLTLGGLWLTRDCHAVSYFLLHSPRLEQLVLLCNSPILYPIPEGTFGFVNHTFSCPNLQKVEILSWENDPRVPWLYEILVQNGVWDEIIELHFVANKDGFRCKVKMLETLHRIWGWIEAEVEKKFDEIARRTGKTREVLKAEKLKRANERLREILSEAYQIDISLLVENIDDFDMI